MKYVVHDSAGNIKRTVECPQGQQGAQLQVGESAVEGNADDRFDMVVGGAIVRGIKLAGAVASPPSLPTIYEKVDAILDYISATGGKDHAKMKDILSKLGK